MEFWSQFTHRIADLREFVVPTYHPERHYMRGPGPACARAQGTRLQPVPVRVRY